jgi:hypothetical protein
VGRGPRRFSATTTKRRVRGPLHHASLALAWSPSPAIAGADNSSPFSRRAFAPELCPRHGKKALRASPKRREAERQKAHHWFPPRRRKISLPAYAARATFAPCPALARSLRGGALAFRRSTAVMRRGSIPRLGSGPRFLESPDPNGRTLSGTSAASTWQSGHAPDGRCPEPPGRELQAPSGNRTRPIDRLSPVDVPSMGEL